MASRVLCVGRNSVDYIFKVKLSALASDAKQRTQEPVIVIGGQCLNAAVTLSALGIPVTYAGVVGADSSGARVLNALGSAGVDASAVERADGHQNPCAYIFVDSENGERSIIETASLAFPPHSGRISEADWAKFTHVYFDGHETAASVVIAREAAKRGIATTCDAEAVTAQTLELLTLVETAIVPKSVAAEIAGSDAPADMLAALAALGGHRHIVTMGSAGALGALHGGDIVIVPAAPCHVVDTTGAGDAFHAGFLFADMSGASFGKAMTIAARVAALACEHMGPRAPVEALARLGSHLSRETWIF
ncbi:MAG: carbohydrate kinase family protein [Parvibaculum sp.]|nr:carbohydrate kinase family protein [Parvibaculum sp.]